MPNKSQDSLSNQNELLYKLIKEKIGLYSLTFNIK